MAMVEDRKKEKSSNWLQQAVALVLAASLWPGVVKVGGLLQAEGRR